MVRSLDHISGLHQRVSPYFELVLAYLQYLSLIYQIDISWPHEWNLFFGWASLSTLDTAFNLSGSSHSLSLLDARAHFLVLTVLIPLALSFMMLIFANPFYIILWFSALLLGFGLLAAGIALLLLGIAGNGKLLVTVGVACVCACAALLFVRYFLRRCAWKRKAEELKQMMRKKRAERQREAEKRSNDSTDDTASTGSATDSSTASVTDSPNPRRHGPSRPLILPAARHLVLSDDMQNITNRVLDQEKEEEREAFDHAGEYKENHYKPKGCLYFLPRLLAVAVLGMAGLVVWGYFYTIPTKATIPAFESLTNVFGPLLIGLAGALLIYTLANCTRYGHERIEKLKNFLEARFIWIMIFSLTLLYIPFTTTAMGGVRCISVSCSQGYEPPAIRTLMLGNAVSPHSYSIQSDGCDACNFMGNCSIASDLCAPVSVRRLVMDLSQPCDVNIQWMIPVAIITGMAITLGTPLLIYRLVVKHTRLLENISVAEGSSTSEKWDTWCSTTRNSAKILYYGFTHKWRFYRMFLLFQRLFISILTIFLFQIPKFLIFFTLAVHSIFFAFNLFVRPYRNLGIDGMAFGTGAGLVATCALGARIILRGGVTQEVAIWLMVIDFLAPAIATAFMVYVQKRKHARTIAPLQAGVELGAHAERDAWEKAKEEEKERKERPLDVVDILINEFTLKTMSNFFIVVGILAFLSLAIGIVGILHSNAGLTVVSPVLSETDQSVTQFAGYTNWTEFTQNCCCSYSTSSTLETWKCLNGYYKERLRETPGRHKLSGLGLRSYCNDTFSSLVCTIPSVDTNFQVVTCPDIVIDDYTLNYLW